MSLCLPVLVFQPSRCIDQAGIPLVILSGLVLLLCVDTHQSLVNLCSKWPQRSRGQEVWMDAQVMLFLLIVVNNPSRVIACSKLSLWCRGFVGSQVGQVLFLLCAVQKETLAFGCSIAFPWPLFSSGTHTFGLFAVIAQRCVYLRSTSSFGLYLTSNRRRLKVPYAGINFCSIRTINCIPLAEHVV